MSKNLDEFIDVFLDALGSMDLSTLEPMSNFVFHPLFDKEWIRRIKLVQTRAEEKGLSLVELEPYIKGISHLRCQLFLLLIDLKTAGVSPERREKLSRFFLDILTLKAKDDIYGRVSNIAPLPKEIKEIRSRPFSSSSEEIAKLLGSLFTSGYHLVNGLYTDFYTDYSAEYYGPYALEDGKFMVIKHFQDLQPVVWKIGRAHV